VDDDQQCELDGERVLDLHQHVLGVVQLQFDLYEHWQQLAEFHRDDDQQREFVGHAFRSRGPYTSTLSRQ